MDGWMDMRKWDGMIACVCVSHGQSITFCIYKDPPRRNISDSKM